MFCEYEVFILAKYSVHIVENKNNIKFTYQGGNPGTRFDVTAVEVDSRVIEIGDYVFEEWS